jgi:hypothetical protein
MNKNLLALTVAASALAFSASAATSNIVGYVKLALKKGNNLVSNPLNNTNTDGNKISSLFGSIDCSVLRWTGSGFNTTDTVAGAGVDSGDDFTLAPGEAVFVAVTADSSVTLVGEALTGTQTVAIKKGNNFVASKIPLSGAADTVLGLGIDGSSVLTWNGNGYDSFDYVDGVGYLTGAPNIAVGQGIVVSATTDATWSKTFTPAP